MVSDPDPKSHTGAERRSYQEAQDGDAVKAAAGRAHLTPSVLIRQWVTERVDTAAEKTDLATTVATLRRDVERVASLVKSA